MSAAGDPVAEVSAWNATHPAGTLVEVTRDRGEVFTTKTRSGAWVIGGHTAVVAVVGIVSGYLLSRVKPIDESDRDRAYLDVIGILREAQITGCGASTNRLIDETIAELERRRLDKTGADLRPPPTPVPSAGQDRSSP